MSKSPNLNLELETSDSTLFRNYRKVLNGNNDGTLVEYSNAQLVDMFAGKFNGGSGGAYLTKSSNSNYAFTWATPSTAPANNDTALLTSGGAYTAINAVDTGSKVEVSGNTVTQLLSPDKFYDFTGTALSSITLTLGSAVSGRENEYKGQFLTGSVPFTVDFPSDITWIGTSPSSLEANKKYQFSILNGIGVMVGVDRPTT